MKSISFLLLLLTLTGLLHAQCSLGCLACEKKTNFTFQCAVCDLHNKYALNGNGQCEKRIIDNCEIGSADHTKSFCLQCKADFYLDQDLKKCVAIPEVSKVPKCTKYSSLNHCSMCEDGNYIKSGLCVAVPTAIEGCVSYNVDGKECVACAGLKFLKDKKCEAFEAANNCLNYSEITCDKCSAGFFKELNYHSTLSLTAPIVHQIILNDKNAEGNVIPPPQTICHKQNIANCTKYLNFKECAQCVTGYYITKDRTCSLNPYNKIPKCKRYSDKVTCVECELTSFLASNQCNPRTMVTNCAKYDRFSSTCVECDATHYLSSNTCQIRAFSRRIEQCTQNNLLADECLACKKRFKLTDDKQGCLLAIDNCQVYEPNSRFSMTSLLCGTCGPGFYPNNNKTECAMQDVINCKTYVVNNPTCSACDRGFYYKSADNLCEPYTQPGCATFETNSDGCATCLKKHYKTGSQCKPYTVSNCLTLDAGSDVCTTCEANHYKDGNDCFKYNLIGCNTPTAGKNECTKCISGYYLKDNLCWKNNLPNCVEASLTKNECTECKKGYYLDSSKYCRPLSIPNCGIFKPNLNECQTAGCNEGYINSGIFCVKPHSPNCETLAVNSNNCATDGCKEGYMKDGFGYCRKQATPFCKKHTNNSNNCSECEVGYYRTGQKCLPQIMKGCINFTNTTSLDCSKCAEGYYRSVNKCYPYTITNCEKPKTDADACEDSKCVTNFVKNPTTGNCQVIELPFCKTLTTTAYPVTCTACHIGYLLQDNQCVVASKIPNCVEPSTTPEKCVVCADGYYLEAAAGATQFTCITQSTLHSSNCIAFKPNSKDCVECKNGYNGAACAANASKTNCLISDGKADQCKFCKKAFYLTGTTCTTNGTDKTDANCLGSSNSTINVCSACKQGFDLVSSFTENIFSIPNCLSIDTTNKGCGQCKEGFQLNSGTLKCDAGTGTILCKKKKVGDTTALSTKAQCVVCNDYATQWLDEATAPTNFQCENRTFKYDNCEDYTKNKNENAATYCRSCKEGMATAQPLNYAYCVNIVNPGDANPTTAPTTADCKVHSLADGFTATKKCVLCIDGKILNSSTNACADKAATKTLYQKGLDDKLLFGAVEAVVTDVQFKLATSLRQVSRTGEFLRYIDCAVGYVREIVDGYLKSADAVTGSFSFGTNIKLLRTNENYWSGKLSPFPHHNTVSNCRNIESITNIAQINGPLDTTVKVKAFAKEMFYNCENITTLTDDSDSPPVKTQGATCLKCKQGYNGYLVKPEFDKDGTAFTRGPVVGLDCSARSNLFEKKYLGLSSLATDLDKLILDDFLQYDSCVDGGTLVVFMEIIQNQYFWSTNLPTDLRKYNSMTCVAHVPLQRLVKNCHIYIIKADQEPDISVDPSYVCVACKPGFKATIASEAVSACVAIDNCDVSNSAKNTWLNNCETCDSGFEWALDATNKTPVFDVCTKTAITNCHLLDGNSTAASKICLICDDGYNVTVAGQCVKVDHKDTNCDTPGREANGYMHAHTEAGISALVAADAEKKFMAVAAFLWWKYENRFPSIQSFGCNACKASYTLVSQLTANPVKACLANWNIFTTAVTNCKIYLGDYSVIKNTSAKCRECKQGYRINSTFTQCLENTDALHACMAENATPICTKCEDGYTLYGVTATKACIANDNCIEWDSASISTASAICSVCKDGYRPKSASSSECELIPPTDPCMKYSKFQKCIKCRNKGHPIHYKKDPYPGVKIICTEKSHTVTFFGNTSFEVDNTGVKLLDTSAVSLELFKLGTAYTKFFAATDPQHLCLPQVNVRNCIQYSGLSCTQCADKYVLGDPFSCDKGDLANCLKYDSNKRCGQCEPGFVVNSSNGQCIARTGKNCLVYDHVIDQCSRCMDGYYLDNDTTTRCVARTNLMCKGFAEDKNVCHECYEGYYLEIQTGTGSASTGKCIKQDHPGCLYSLTESNHCRICDQGFYLNRDGTCKKYTFTGCDIWSPVEDKCILCLDEFYKDSSKCTLRINLNCLQFKYHLDECISCQDNFYRKDNKCIEYSVTGCSIYNPYRDRCEACIDGLFLDNNGHCVISDDPNCEIKGDYLHDCLKCLDTSYHNPATNKCINYSVNCEHYNPYADECFSCSENSFWIEGKCTPYKAKNCLVHSLFEDRCLSCNPGYYFKVDICSPIVIENCDMPNHRDAACVICSEGYFNNQGRCQVYTLLNCQMKDPSQNKCYRCEQGFYLNDSGLCQAYTTTGCHGYLPNSDRCSSCLGEFYMHDGKCKEYTKTNCILRDDFADACLSCDEEHYLSGDMCVKYTQKNCATFDKNADRCLTCVEGHYDEGFSCKPYSVTDCKTMSKFANLCLECQGQGIFRNGLGLCQKSTIIANCGTYNKYFNRCDQCSDGFFLENKACTANPTGVPKCSEYSDDSICYRCESPYYLKENICIISSVIIDKCAFYSHESICARCDASHILIANQCKPHTNLTCLEWSSPENCSKCATEKMINPSGSTVVCDDIGITDCAEAAFSADGKHTCTKCKNTFYLEENKCKSGTLVSNCQEYSTSALCAKCIDAHILAQDKKSCTAIDAKAGSNCAVAHFNEKPACTVCKPGFIFNTTGACVPCEVTGCALCDVINNRKCKLCMPGYQMTELFYCETINAIEGGSLGDTRLKMTEQDMNNQENQAFIFRFGSLMLMALAFIGFKRF